MSINLIQQIALTILLLDFLYRRFWKNFEKTFKSWNGPYILALFLITIMVIFTGAGILTFLQTILGAIHK